jgi:uncharacterized protein (DUF1501 family)
MARMGLGMLGTSCARWLPAFAAEVAADPRRTRHCILLWMSGGPSQMDTFDMKPGHNNGGEFKERETAAPGLRFSEHLPKLAAHANKLAVVRSLTTKEGDHERGTHLVRTGHPPQGEVPYPSIACSLSKELEAGAATLLPAYVSVAPVLQISPTSFGPGFLGPRYAPAIVGGQQTLGPQPPQQPQANGFAELKLDDLELSAGVSDLQATRRMKLWAAMEKKYLAHGGPASFEAHNALYRKAADMMRPEVSAAFDLTKEDEKVRTGYGRGLFGQGCLLARRLVERGVPFVEVALGGGLGWDTHQDNFRTVKRLSEELDAGWATLMAELEERGLLESTTILWIGEFGRTPQINPNAGRDHFPGAWSCVFAGGGIAGGQAYGRTSAGGVAVEENQVAIGDVLATLSMALGVPPDHENQTASGRPIKVAEGSPIRAILA